MVPPVPPPAPAPPPPSAPTRAAHWRPSRRPSHPRRCPPALTRTRGATRSTACRSRSQGRPGGQAAPGDCTQRRPASHVLPAPPGSGTPPLAAPQTAGPAAAAARRPAFRQRPPPPRLHRADAGSEGVVGPASVRASGGKRVSCCSGTSEHQGKAGNTSTGQQPPCPGPLQPRPPTHLQKPPPAAHPPPAAAAACAPAPSALRPPPMPARAALPPAALDWAGGPAPGLQSRGGTGRQREARLSCARWAAASTAWRAAPRRRQHRWQVQAALAGASCGAPHRLTLYATSEMTEAGATSSASAPDACRPRMPTVGGGRGRTGGGEWGGDILQVAPRERVRRVWRHPSGPPVHHLWQSVQSSRRCGKAPSPPALIRNQCRILDLWQSSSSSRAAPQPPTPHPHPAPSPPALG